jgi:hypothetical protein
MRPFPGTGNRHRKASSGKLGRLTDGAALEARKQTWADAYPAQPIELSPVPDDPDHPEHMSSDGSDESIVAGTGDQNTAATSNADF